MMLPVSCRQSSMWRGLSFLVVWGLIGAAGAPSEAAQATKSDARSGPPIFAVHLIEGDQTYEGVLKMRFEKEFSGSTAVGRLDIGFAKIQRIEPVEQGRRLKVKMTTGEEVTVEIMNSLYLSNETYGNIDLDMEKIKFIERIR